jgi:hypothetical protein
MKTKTPTGTRLLVVIRNNIILRIQTMIWEVNLCLVGIT